MMGYHHMDGITVDEGTRRGIPCWFIVVESIEITIRKSDFSFMGAIDYDLDESDSYYGVKQLAMLERDNPRAYDYAMDALEEHLGRKVPRHHFRGPYAKRTIKVTTKKAPAKKPAPKRRK